MTEDDARVDIRAAGFWVVAIIALFLMFGFLTLLLSLTSLLVQLPLSGDTSPKNVGLMRSVSRKWNGAVLHHLCFPLQGVRVTRAATVTYKRLASLLSDKWNSPYPVVMGWLRCSLGFSLLRSSLMCLCGSRSSSGSPGVPSSVHAAVAEGHLAINYV